MAPHTIAVAVKFGVGKSTTCGMIIDYLCAKKRGPVLVVDADANSNLNEVLGVEVEPSLGQIREDMAHQIPSIMQTSKKIGMQTMDDSLFSLYLKHKIDAANAVEYAQDTGNMQQKLF